MLDHVGCWLIFFPVGRRYFFSLFVGSQLHILRRLSFFGYLIQTLFYKNEEDWTSEYKEANRQCSWSQQ